MITRLLFVHALSPLHAGTGQGVGAIDLPVAREKATGIPYLPGSSLKGTLRDRCTDKDDCKAVFGPDTQGASEHAGATQFADARLVLLPVRSLAGTFAWVTSPYLLERLARDAAEAGEESLPAVPRPGRLEDCVVAEATGLKSGEKVYLEDLDLTPSSGADEWAGWLFARLGLDVKPRLCIVHDDAMGFLLDTATEIVARIKLEDDSKTVARGGLWYEESLPAETVLVSLVLAGESRERRENGAAARLSPKGVLEVVRGLMGKAMQLGGKATVGRGLCRLRLAGGAG